MKDKSQEPRDGALSWGQDQPDAEVEVICAATILPSYHLEYRNNAFPFQSTQEITSCSGIKPATTFYPVQ